MQTYLVELEQSKCELSVKCEAKGQPLLCGKKTISYSLSVWWYDSVLPLFPVISLYGVRSGVLRVLVNFESQMQGHRKVIDIGGAGPWWGWTARSPLKLREFGHFSNLKTNFSWYLTVWVWTVKILSSAEFSLATTITGKAQAHLSIKTRK